MLCHAGNALALSQDQTADVEAERHRVQAAGASVQWRVDSWRIGEAGIQVTRYGQMLSACELVWQKEHSMTNQNMRACFHKSMMYFGQQLMGAKDLGKAVILTCVMPVTQHTHKAHVKIRLKGECTWCSAAFLCTTLSCD